MKQKPAFYAKIKLQALV